jgi:hypothetical protein
MNRLIVITILVLVPVVLFAQINWIERTIDENFDNAGSVFAIDMEPDGDIDVLGAAWHYPYEIAWWENNGNEDFTKHTIDANFFYVWSVYAIDLDSDGDGDVLASSEANDLTWWENDGSENFTEHTISPYFHPAQSVYAIDLDDDNDVDILSSVDEMTSDYYDAIVWWENDGNENFTRHTVFTGWDWFTGVQSVYAIDIEPDGDVDILGAYDEWDGLGWWKNDGEQNFTWQPSIWTSTLYDIYAIDLDNDTDVDILGAAFFANEIAWYENDGNEYFTEHIIDNYFDGAFSVYAVDLDNDSDIDVVGAARNADDIAWWENDGGSPPSFTKHTIDGYFDGVNSVYAIDLDDDKDIDVLGAALYADDITWWENDLVTVDVGPVSIDIPATLPEDTTVNPHATVTNFGSDSSSFDVTCKIDPGEYTSIVNVINLAPNDSVQITFPDAFTFESGSYTVTVYTQLIGDDHPENDTLVKIVFSTGITEGNTNLLNVFSFGLKNNPTAKALFNLVLPKDGFVMLRIYDVTGRLVDNLSSRRSAGYHQIPWHSKADGVYFYTFEMQSYKEKGKLVIVK